MAVCVICCTIEANLCCIHSCLHSQLNLGSGLLVHSGSNGDTGAHRPASYGSDDSVRSAQGSEGYSVESPMEQNMLSKYMRENESLRSDMRYE